MGVRGGDASASAAEEEARGRDSAGAGADARSAAAPQGPPEPLVSFAGARLGYGRRAVVDGVDLAIRPGERWALCGPNGAGKSTLARTLLGRLPILGGRLERRAGLAIGYVPQHQALDPIYPLSLADVVAMGCYGRLGSSGAPRAADRRAIADALAELDLTTLADRRFRELSGGQQQRGLIARALAGEPDLLLLDEPTASLDGRAAWELRANLEALGRRRAIAMVLVTHDLELALALCAHVAVLADGGLVTASTADDAALARALAPLFPTPCEIVEVRGRRLAVPAGAPATLPAARAGGPP